MFFLFIFLNLLYFVGLLNILNQEVLNDTENKVIDLEASDWILYNDGDTMMEIKYPEDDIRIKIKER